MVLCNDSIVLDTGDRLIDFWVVWAFALRAKSNGIDGVVTGEPSFLNFLLPDEPIDCPKDPLLNPLRLLRKLSRDYSLISGVFYLF